jgi:hypothetical protein
MADKKHTTIQQVLGAFLSSHGQHEAAAQAFEATDRVELNRLAEIAMRTAPAWNKTDACRVIKLAMDEPAMGGPGNAQDFEIRKEAHPFKANEFLYRAYVLKAEGPVDVGMVAPEIETIITRLVGAFIVRNVKYPEQF